MNNKKIVLDTNIVKDLLKYHKDKQYKSKNSIDTEKVYNYITNMEFDGVSKCYVTIYTVYEILKDFKNIKDEYRDFATILYPQIITSEQARKFINDFDLVNLHEKDNEFQIKVLERLRNLIIDLYANNFADVFITVILIAIRLIEYLKYYGKWKHDEYDCEKRMNDNISFIHISIRNKLKKDLPEYLSQSKNKTTTYFDIQYKRILQCSQLLFSEMESKTNISYKKINISLNKLSNRYFNIIDEEVKDDYNLFTNFFLAHLNNKTTKINYKDKTDEEIFEIFKDQIISIAKTNMPRASNLVDESFYNTLKDLFFRDFTDWHTEKRANYQFGVDINDIIDTYIIRLCQKGKYYTDDLPILTADTNMRKLLYKYIPSSKYWCEKFSKKIGD